MTIKLVETKYILSPGTAVRSTGAAHYHWGARSPAGADFRGVPGSIVMQIQPRLIRLRDAPAYLGMDRNRFNREARKELTEIPIGKQGIAFDRIEMDDWAEQ